MVEPCRLRSACMGLLLATAIAAQDWPMGSGPNGDWVATGPLPPLRFSGTTGENVRWRTPLPAAGQGGIAVVGDRVYVATMAPWDGNGLDAADAARFAHAVEKRTVVGKDIDAHCLDAATGELLWTRRIAGVVPSIHAYPFSDATSASPVADAGHVWFTNAGGAVVCFTRGGDEVWRRAFEPTSDGPFNKQFEPFLVADPARGEHAQTFVHMEPFAQPDGTRWNRLVGLDAATGAELWRSADALTHYNAPTLVHTEAGICVLHARGGPHAVPERPVGMSLLRVTGADAGKAVWRYEDTRGNREASLQTMAADARFACWLLKTPDDVLVLVDVHTGREVRAVSLRRSVTVTAWDAEKHALVTAAGVDLDKGVFPARYSLHAVAGHVFFQCYATQWGKPDIGPPYSFARITVGDDAAQDRVEYLEVPTATTRDAAGAEAFVWRTPRQARALDHGGREVTGDERSRWDGWDWVFNGSPTRVGDRLYHTLATGAVYVLDTAAPVFDGRAFLALNDLGADGATWSANSVSYAKGRLFHRTAAAVFCIGTDPTAAKAASGR